MHEKENSTKHGTRNELQVQGANIPEILRARVKTRNSKPSVKSPWKKRRDQNNSHSYTSNKKCKPVSYLT